MTKAGGPDDGLPPFDEDFIGGGPVELSANQRAIEQARQAAAERAKVLRDQQFEAARSARRVRNRHLRARLNRVAQLVVVVAAVGAGGWWVAGHPGFHRSASVATPASLAGPAGETLPSDVTSTTVVRFANFDYGPGDCITWDQSLSGIVDTTRVACGQTHLIEVTSGVFTITGFGTSYPSYPALRDYYIRHCTDPAAKFLGYALDPYGRFGPSAVGPSADDWAQGDRTATCDLQLRSGDSKAIPFSGEVRGANQEEIYPMASCGQDTTAPVPCTGPHTWQITGNIDVSGTTALPATDAAWQALVGSKCASFAVAFLGGAYPPGVQSGWQPLQPSSWAAGERTIQCIVARYPPNGGGAESITGSLAGAGR